MTDLIYDYITMGVDMIISAAILSAVVLLVRSATLLNSYSAQQQASADMFNYYKEFSMYDCTDDLLYADVLSALSYYRYDLDIVIQCGSNLYMNRKSDGTFHVGSIRDDNANIRTFKQISEAVPTNKRYKAYVTEDLNSSPSTSGYKGGAITGITFIMQ